MLKTRKGKGGNTNKLKVVFGGCLVSTSATEQTMNVRRMCQGDEWVIRIERHSLTERVPYDI